MLRGTPGLSQAPFPGLPPIRSVASVVLHLLLGLRGLWSDYVWASVLPLPLLSLSYDIVLLPTPTFIIHCSSQHYY